ncbi:unnamed protein product [Adineta ricciae]|uniref:Uncharacterized protein n=1 Tax=Adineta ricciae TaxID=249248 RepID=A0A814ZQK2_ADIRI|nr:unnamed protein product [Adineta ricciae]
MFTLSSTTGQQNNSMSFQAKQSKRFNRELKYSSRIPKLVQTQFAQFLNNLLEYSSELAYFAINAFQTSSLRRVQVNTMQRFSGFCLPRTCVFYYNLDAEFDNFVQNMRTLCALAKRTFLDIRVTRIHASDSKMMSLPIIRRSIGVFKCNINRLRDLKRLHQDIDHDLLLPNDQLYLALDLLLTDFELLNCELDAEVKFADAMILQTIIKDIFLQFRLALSWIYPAIQHAAYRPGDPNPEHEVKKCDQQATIRHVDNFCGKRKEKKSNESDLRSLTHLKRDRNENCIKETTKDTENEKKKKKYSRKILVIPTVNNGFHRYLHKKKLHSTGIIHLQRSQSNPNILSMIKNISEMNYK